MIAWRFLGRMEHAEALLLQESLRERVLAGDLSAQTILLVEHPPTITMGRAAKAENVLLSGAELATRGIVKTAISRGGDVTYHGPGQLVVYPVVRLRGGGGLVAMMEAVAGVLCERLRSWAPEIEWRERPHAGIWIGSRKVGSVGVHVTRGVAIHGFALNIADVPGELALLEGFSTIVPCGLSCTGITTIERELHDRQVDRDLPTVAALAAAAGPEISAALSALGPAQSENSGAKRTVRGSKIAVIYSGDWLGSGVRANEDVLAVANSIAAALRARGADAFALPVTGLDVCEIVPKQLDAKTDLVVNLCESLRRESRFEGVLPTLLDLAGIPYTGSPPLALTFALDKTLAKQLLSSRGIPTPKWIALTPGDLIPEALPFGFPAFVKLAREDASIGISTASVVRSALELHAQCTRLFAEYKQPVVIEAFVDGRELNVTMLGNGQSRRLLPIHEIDFSLLPESLPKIITYDGKWDESHPEYIGTDPKVAALSPELAESVEKIALAAFDALGLRDYGRCDLRVDSAGIPLVIDVNPNCDLSPSAGVARAARAAGLTYEDLVQSICEAAWNPNRRAK